MKKISLALFLTLFCFPLAWGQGNLSAVQILQKAENLIAGAKGVEASFTIYNSGYSGGGEIKTLGGKFKVTLPDVEVWYNGKDLYTYNKRSQETTVVEPDAEELEASNPLAYVAGASKKYNVSFSTVKKQDRYVLELLPKAKGEIKRITLTLKKNDFAPEKIVVEPKSGSPITAEIKSFKTSSSLSASEFEYPKAKYSKVELIDLR